MAQILVTGGAGFIAGALARGLAEDPRNEVVIVDNLVTGSTDKVPSLANVRFEHADVNDRGAMERIFGDHHFEAVFHYAALVGVRRTLDNPVMVLRDIDGIRNVLDFARDAGVKRVFYSSSSEVYGEPVHVPQNEHTTPLNSRLPYAIVKNVGEAFLRSYHKEYGLDYTVFRFFNTYGPGQSQDFVMTRFIRAALRGEDITIYGDGSQTRTFCFIDDNTATALRCFNEGRVMNDVINIGSDQEITILDLARKIIDATGSSSRIIHLPPLAEGDMSRRQPDISLMREVLGRELVPLETGLVKTIEALR